MKGRRAGGGGGGDGTAPVGEQGRDWLAALPALIGELAARWTLDVEGPGPEGTCSFVANVRRANGEAAVLKVPIPHREAEHEAFALRLWRGDGTVKLLEVDACGAMLLERALPGAPLADCEDRVQVAAVGGELVRRLHLEPPAQHPFELLPDVCAEWAELARQRVRELGRRSDRALVDEGAELLEALPRDTGGSVLLHGDFHHWNVLAATRESWLVIDPKPMVGDPVFDAARFLQNHHGFVRGPEEFRRGLHLFAEASRFDIHRVLLWSFARTIEDAMWELSVGDEEDSRRSLGYARLVRRLLRARGE